MQVVEGPPTHASSSITSIAISPSRATREPCVFVYFAGAPPLAVEPLRQRGVETAGHGILDRRRSAGRTRAPRRAGDAPAGHGVRALHKWEGRRETRFEREHVRRARRQARPRPSPDRCRPTGSRGSRRARRPAPRRDARQLRLVDRPLRMVAGAWNARPESVRRQCDEPRAALLHDSVPTAAMPPASSHACAEPSVGCPANGSSPPGVKIRRR